MSRQLAQNRVNLVAGFLATNFRSRGKPLDFWLGGNPPEVDWLEIQPIDQ